jgi:hypothetical protein
MDTSSLKGHTAHCAASKSQPQDLEYFGLTTSTPKRLTPEIVREYSALWVAESAWPFSIVNNTYVSTIYAYRVNTSSNTASFSFENYYTPMHRNIFCVTTPSTRMSGAIQGNSG